MNEKQQKRLDIALAWRDKGAVSVQFESLNSGDPQVISVQFHSDIVLSKEQQQPASQSK